MCCVMTFNNIVLRDVHSQHVYLQTHGIKNVTLEGGKKFVGVAVYWEE